MTYQPSTSYGPIRSAEYYADHEEYMGSYGELVPSLNISAIDTVYYPWWSVDYYYLGSHLYPPSFWFGPRRTVGIGFGPNYWPYYSFYSPYYSPYSMFGWPRYGIGTNFYWQDIYWVARDNYRAPPRQSDSDRQPYGVTRYGDFGDPFNDPRDRAPYSSVDQRGLMTTSGTRTGSMEVRRRNNSKIGESKTGSTAARKMPGTASQPIRSPIRSTVSSPQPVSRPSSISRPSSSSSVRIPQAGKKHKN